MSQVPQSTSGVRAAHVIPIPRAPKAPQVVLYDQYNNAGGNATLSATFDDFPTFSSDLADDFVVPGGQTWNVESIDADGVYFNGAGPAFNWNVFIYANNGTLPGAPVYSTLNQPVTQVGTTFTVNLTPAAVLPAGTYWIEIQANMDFATQGEWGWTDRTVQSNNPAAWQNPGGGFGICPTWAPKLAVCVPTASGPDQVYRINGTTGGGGSPTPTATGSPAGCSTYTTATGTGSITPGDTDTGSHCDDCNTTISFPFPVSVYGQTFNSGDVSSNGTLNLTGGSAAFTHGCLVLPNSFWEMGILPYQDDLRTDQFSGCSGFPGGTCGIFTSVTGTAPNRQFNIEWRAVHFADTTAPANFEVVFYENQSSFFDVFYGATSDNGLDETSGVQQSSAGPATTFSCGTATLTNGLKVTYSCQGAASPTPTPSPSCTPSSFHVLIAYADAAGPPSQLQSEIQAEPNVASVDLFDAASGTPTLAQLQQYQIVVPFSNNPFLDADTLGNNLADYVDGGGVVVQYGFSHYGPGQPYGVNGRWVSGNYNPYSYSTNLQFNPFSLGTHNAGHPLMAGVTTLNGDFENIVTPAAGATEVAQDNFGDSLVAYRPVSGGHTTVGVTAYVGVDATQSGDWGKVIVNAGNWLLGGGGCGSPTPTPTGSPSCTPNVINGSIDTADPTQTDRLFRSGIPQTCPASTTCAIFGDPTARHYDSYTFTNTTGATQCVTVDTNTACTGTNFIFIGAYLGSFDPSNICTNWIGDSGFSPNPEQAFQFNLDNGQTAVIVVSEVTPNAGCPAYTVTITGLCGGGTPTATPTASPTVSATPTASPSATATVTGTPSPTPTCSAGGTPGPWTLAANYPLTLESAAVTSDGTFGYSAGGFAGFPTDAFYRYDPVANSWTPLANVGIGFYDAGIAYAANTNKIYVFGGFDPNFVVLATTQIYDIATNTWTTGAPMPDAKCA
jgi:hypothetical protein